MMQLGAHVSAVMTINNIQFFGRVFCYRAIFDGQRHDRFCADKIGWHRALRALAFQRMLSFIFIQCDSQFPAGASAIAPTPDGFPASRHGAQ